jgi:hypothetical protein
MPELRRRGIFLGAARNLTAGATAAMSVQESRCGPDRRGHYLAIYPTAHPLPCDCTMMINTMTKTPERPLWAEPACILRWVFHRGPDVLTCAVEAGADRSSYDVCVLPHWNLSVATVEHFDAAASALQRHAEIALRLRQSGWVARYGASRSTSIAA